MGTEGSIGMTARSRLLRKAGSGLVNKLNRARSIQIALRLPAPDLAAARAIAEQKGVGYQTLLKMLVHEGLCRETKRRAG